MDFFLPLAIGWAIGFFAGRFKSRVRTAKKRELEWEIGNVGYLYERK